MSSPFRKPVMCKRRAAGAYVEGRWVEGAESSFMILASVQPATGSDMKAVPENRRRGSMYAIFTDTALQELSEEGSLQGDVVTLYDGDYEVVHVERWQNNIINHWKAIVRRFIPGVQP